MTLSYSRDPFCCFAASQDLGTFWDCHRRAFAHFVGVPAVIVYDRTRTVVRRHVGRGQATPLHPEAVAFASHDDFTIWLAAPYRAQTKGRVERQVEIVRSHVLAGRSFASLAEVDAASPPGCRFAARRPTAPTARSSRCGPNATGPRLARCPSSRMESATGTPAGSARTP